MTSIRKSLEKRTTEQLRLLLRGYNLHDPDNGEMEEDDIQCQCGCECEDCPCEDKFCDVCGCGYDEGD